MVYIFIKLRSIHIIKRLHDVKYVQKKKTFFLRSQITKVYIEIAKKHKVLIVLK